MPPESSPPVRNSAAKPVDDLPAEQERVAEAKPKIKSKTYYSGGPAFESKIAPSMSTHALPKDTDADDEQKAQEAAAVAAVKKKVMARRVNPYASPSRKNLGSRDLVYHGAVVLHKHQAYIDNDLRHDAQKMWLETFDEDEPEEYEPEETPKPLAPLDEAVKVVAAPDTTTAKTSGLWKPAPMATMPQPGPTSMAPRYTAPQYTDASTSTTKSQAPAAAPAAAPAPKVRGAKFAEKMLKGMGYVEGQGLGAQGQGIVNPLEAQAPAKPSQKRKAKPSFDDTEHASSTHRPGIGSKGAEAYRLRGGELSAETTAALEAERRAGPGEPSQVVRLTGAIAGFDVQAELASGTLMQDLGEALAQFGMIERLYLAHELDAQDGLGVPVFVKFNDTLSGINCVERLVQAPLLLGDIPVAAKFWPAARFARMDLVDE